jgi:hypothetical protein
MRHASKSASYKPALLKALVRCCQQSAELLITLDSIGREFAKLYWNQTVVYHLRQAVSLTKEASAVKLIRKTSEKYKTRDLSALPAEARRVLDARMSRLLTVNVLAAFHTSKPSRMPRLYDWKSGWDHVALTPASRDFLRQHAQELELIANFYWAEFLENCNRLAPRIVQKVSRDGQRRRSLRKYMKILMGDGSSCFYCGTDLGASAKPTVDHVIPWSFLLEEDLWDLVLACERCNSAKSDSLPPRQFIEKLIDRNKQLFDAGISLAIDESEITRLYEAAISVEWPQFWGR